MKDTWDYDLMSLLKQAYTGDSSELNSFLEKFSELAVVNEDQTVLLLLRHFNVNYWEGKRRVTNTHPSGEDFQKGITVVTRSDDSGAMSNIYIPNDREYKELRIKEKEIDIVLDDSNIVNTNLTELYRKMRFWGKFEEKDLEEAFYSLCNEQYEEKKKPEVVEKVLKVNNVGELNYSEKFEWYEGKIILNDTELALNIYYASPKELAKIAAFVSKQINAKFYDRALLEMEKDMIVLKNDTWLGEDEDTGEEESPITAEQFRKRISISSMVFYDDCSSTIYCKDGDVFWGHSIVVNIDKNGNYEDANLAG